MTYTTTYSTDTGELVIEFDYRPGEDATFDYPGCDEDVDLVAVMAGDIDILEFVHGQWIERFKEKCFEAMTEIKFDAEMDRGQDRYENRMEA